MPRYLPALSDCFPSLTAVDDTWKSDENLRVLISGSPLIEREDDIFSAQFLDDMKEFVEGLDAYNNAHPARDRIALLVGEETDQKIQAMDVGEIGSTKFRGEFALKHKGQVYAGEYFFDNIALVHGVYFKPHRVIEAFGNTNGAFYFGYNPRNDVGGYLDWLVRSPMTMRPGPQP